MVQGLQICGQIIGCRGAADWKVLAKEKGIVIMNKEFVSPTLENAQIEKLTKQLMEANQKLTVLQKEREMMLSNISHDLRAPITAIRGAIDLSLSTKEPTVDELLKTMSIVDRRTKTLEDLINDMYYLFCIEDKARPMDMSTLSAGPLLEEYFYDVIADSRYDSFDMKLDVPGDLDCEIVIDTQKFLRVLDNLFTNAAKYAADGKNPSITLSARKVVNMVTVDGGAGSSKKNSGKIEYRKCLEICVTDTGKGIPKEALPHIFTRTYTVSSARTPEKEKSGSGLGLAIAKAIIERHEGTITCKSEEGKGTSFVIVIPCE